MKTLFAAAVAVSLLTGAVATANADEGRDRGHRYGRDHHDRGDRGRHDNRNHDRRDFRGHERRDDRHDRHREGRHYNDWRDHDRHRYDHDRLYRNWDRRDAYRAGYARGRYDRGRYIQPRGFYHHHWRHGDHLPRAYYSSRYVIHDYHAYHLSRPPYGYHWVRVNDDVILAAVASGLVVSVVNGLFY